ncbi:hypothetical protein CPAV1605_1575 [seawater metagenome]|uniref:OTU domain-containing protein n=1 Tax=seawater metagenome TaxID=1561972 RepID=A0A5E8CK73_9ZZZZ
MADLSFPFRLYPYNLPNFESPFVDSNYKNQVLRLIRYLRNLSDSLTESTLNIFIVGSLLDDDPEYFSKHYYQHIPQFVINYLEINPDALINIIVISPALTSPPQTISKLEKEFLWDQLDENVFGSRKYRNLKYAFFKCPIPEYVATDFKYLPGQKALKLEGTNKMLPIYYYKKLVYRRLMEINPETNTFRLKSLDSLSSRDRDFAIATLPKLRSTLLSPKDIDFVGEFYGLINRLVNKTIDLRGANLCLNYAVFNDYAPGIDKYYFLKTFYLKFKDRISFLFYQFHNASTKNLINLENGQLYDYANKNLTLSFSKGRVVINEKSKKSRYYVDKEKKINYEDDKIYVDGKEFFIKPVNPDGNCMFEAVLSQTGGFPSLLELRRKVVDSIANKQNLIEEIYRNIYNEGFYKDLMDKWTREGKSEEYIRSNILDLYFYFMKNGPGNPEVEEKRIQYNLPVQVYYGGHIELQEMAKLMNIRIGVIEGEEENTIITYYNTIGIGTIYLRSIGQHIDIAELKNDSKDDGLKKKNKRIKE